MCGICGIFDGGGAPIAPYILDSMMAAMRHRGPDGEGRHFDPGVALGHLRLSIIDLQGGAQPIGNEDGSLQVVFNGEIYNYVELRNELAAFGHQFKTRSDTEVIPHAYEQWGLDCVTRFNGMFAFAIWDSRKSELILARDHLGIKPLYYFTNGDDLVFASEIKALLQHPDCPRGMDERALAELFTFRYVPSPRTLFSGIHKLPPAHLLTMSRRGVRVRRFWNSVPHPRQRYNEGELIEEYQSLVEDAVRLQMRSDVPLGVFLSSGVDSGALLAIMSRHAPGRLRTFTIGFEGGEASDEVGDARETARAFGAEHDHQILGPEDYARYYQRYMWDIEEPVGNETAAAFYFLSKLTRTHTKVAITGQGADEPWAGYDRYKGIKLSDWYSRLPAFLTRRLAASVTHLPGRFERIKRGVVSLAEPDILTRLTKVYSFFSEEMKSKLYRNGLQDEFLADHYGTRHALARLQRDVQTMDPLTQMLYIDTRANLPDDLLMVADKTSMANSLEVRVPFLDYRLIEFVESLPGHLKLRGFTGKYLHKKACQKWLPRNVVHRKKKGFANPIEHWFRQNMRTFVDDCLLAPDSALRDYFDQGYIKQILELDRSGRQQYRRHIYLLVSLELWYRRYIGKPAAIPAVG